MGIALETLEDPIRAALKTYQEISDNGLRFDRDRACRLDLTPDKPNSARSATDALFQKEPIGKLYVIAFKPGDGTGSQDYYQLNNLKVDSQYPTTALVVPRDKVGVHSEAHLTIVRYGIEDPHAEPQLYAGSFDLLGLDGNFVRKIGELGHPEKAETTFPVATFTVGYRGSERFGDPHAIYSKIPGTVQVCAFLAVTDEIHKMYPNILDGLNPQLPIKPHIEQFSFQGNLFDVLYVESIQVKEGIVCDVYKFKDDPEKDLAIVTVSEGAKTPLQKILKGDVTIEGYISGNGKLVITDLNGVKHEHRVGNELSKTFSLAVQRGELMRWQADEKSTLSFYEICFPPYEDGRFENLAE